MATPTVLGSPPFAFLATSGSGHTISTSYTCPSGGQNRLLVFMIDVGAGVSAVSGTWNGSENLTIGTIYGGNVKNMFYGWVANPTSGSHTFALTWTGTGSYSCYVVTLQDAAQTSPIDANTGNGVVTTTSISTNISTTASSALLLLDLITSNSATPVFSPNGSQTTVASLTTADGSASMGSYKAVSSSSGTETMAWTWTGGSFYADTQIIAVKYLAPASGPTNVKTWTGITQSTGIKTYIGTALASVKTVIGLS